jgi:hypothetical protein
MNLSAKIALSLIVSTAILDRPQIAVAGSTVSTAAAISIEFQPSGNSADFAVSPGGGFVLSNATGIRSISTAVAAGDTAFASAQTTAAGTRAVAQGLTSSTVTLNAQTLNGLTTGSTTGLTIAPNSLVVGSDLVGTTLP